MKGATYRLSAEEGQAKILPVFLHDPHAELTISDTARLARMTYSQACRNLRFLAVGKALKRRPHAGMAWYRLARPHGAKP